MGSNTTDLLPLINTPERKEEPGDSLELVGKLSLSSSSIGLAD